MLKNIGGTSYTTYISHNTTSTATDVISVDVKSMVFKSSNIFYKSLIAMCQYWFNVNVNWYWMLRKYFSK